MLISATFKVWAKRIVMGVCCSADQRSNWRHEQENFHSMLRTRNMHTYDIHKLLAVLSPLISSKHLLSITFSSYTVLSMEVICVHSPEGKQDPLMTNTATAHLMSYLAKETSIKELTIFSDGASSTYHAR